MSKFVDLKAEELRQRREQAAVWKDLYRVQVWEDSQQKKRSFGNDEDPAPKKRRSCQPQEDRLPGSPCPTEICPPINTGGATPIGGSFAIPPVRMAQPVPEEPAPVKRKRSQQRKDPAPEKRRRSEPKAPRTTGGRCGECSGCRAEDCLTCIYCKDKRSYGGAGVLKKACVLRTCTNRPTPNILGIQLRSGKILDGATQPRPRRRRCGACSGCRTKDCKRCFFCWDKQRYCRDSIGGKGILKKVCERRTCENVRPQPKEPRRERRRCNQKTCTFCTRLNCGMCVNCLDMRRFGGPGRRKKACENRKCSNMCSK